MDGINCHGISRVFAYQKDKNISRFRVYLWWILSICGICLLVWLLYQNFTEYLQRQIIYQTNVLYSSRLQLPAITLCNTNQLFRSIPYYKQYGRLSLNNQFLEKFAVYFKNLQTKDVYDVVYTDSINRAVGLFDKKNLFRNKVEVSVHCVNYIANSVIRTFFENCVWRCDSLSYTFVLMDKYTHRLELVRKQFNNKKLSIDCPQLIERMNVTEGIDYLSKIVLIQQQVIVYSTGLIIRGKTSKELFLTDTVLEGIVDDILKTNEEDEKVEQLIYLYLVKNKDRAKHWEDYKDGQLLFNLINTFSKIVQIESKFGFEPMKKSNEVFSRTNVKDFVLLCKINNETCEKDIEIIETDAGNCFTINHRKDKVFYQTIPTANAGFEFIIFNHHFDVDEETNSIIHPSNGVLVSVHDPESHEYIIDNNILAPTGSLTQIILQRKAYDYTDTTTVSNCDSDFNVENIMDKHENFESCKKRKIEEDVREKFNCRLLGDHTYPNMTICQTDYAKQSLVFNYLSIVDKNDLCGFNCYQNLYTIENYVSPIPFKKMFSKYSYLSYKCFCKKNFGYKNHTKNNKEYVYFDPNSMSPKEVIESNRQCLTENNFKDNIVHIKVSFWTLHVPYHRRTPKVSLSVFIANIGGAMGVALGMSFLTIIEFLELFFNYLWEQPKRNRIDPNMKNGTMKENLAK
ncbi:hypothetical protein SNEBB_003426 [Seison nebaliae]|nr:hypothetical protein SNEBB_003426 [Seison nebaliae]